jgi:hypothetical protein
MLGQETHSPPEDGSDRTILPLACCAWLALFGIGQAIFIFGVPSFELPFDAFEDRLPKSTRILLRLSPVARSPLGVAGSTLAVLSSLGILLLPISKRRKGTIYLLLWVAVAIFLAYSEVSLFVPLVNAIPRVGGK